MLHTIYKITNKLNGKIYIGKHSTEDINDNYMGSGKYIKKAIIKYGVENFIKEILFIFSDEKEAYDMEKQIVNENFIKRVDVYNVIVGGDSFESINSNIENTEVWDSLGSLTIYATLSRITKGESDKVKGLVTLTSIRELVAKLKEEKIIK